MLFLFDFISLWFPASGQKKTEVSLWFEGKLK